MIEIKIPKNIGSAYKREITRKPENLVKVYIGSVIAAIVIFVVFGIRPLATTTAQNAKLLSELLGIRQDLQTKVQKLAVEGEKIDNLGREINLLHERLPEETNLEEYLRTLVLDAAKSGFVVQRFRQQEGIGDSTTLELDFTGSLLSVPKLIEELENSERFVEIKSIRTTLTDNGNAEVRVVLIVHTLQT